MSPDGESRAACAARDAADPLAPLRDQFVLPDGVVYLDGNSLGPLPRATADHVRDLIEHEWGNGLIRSWNTAGWMDAPQRVGDMIATLIGAAAGEVIVADSTSVNLFKVLTAALGYVRGVDARRRVVVSDIGNFPSDLYIASGVAEAAGFELRAVRRVDIESSLDETVAVLLLTQVDYRTGALHDLAGVTAKAHRHGVLTVWDLAHSAGAIDLDLAAADADFAVGCGYKYLNGGPGAPAFVWVNRRLVDSVDQPLHGWIGHADPFAFSSAYSAAGGIAGFQCGTPAVLSLAALECGVATVVAAAPFGGMAALRAKSIRLSELFLRLVAPVCDGFGLEVISPADPRLRGSQVSLTHPTRGYEIVQALIDRGVIGDFRAPDVLRFGFTPLYTREVDVWDAVEHLRVVLHDELWRDSRWAERGAVT